MKAATGSTETAAGWLYPADERASLYLRDDPEVAGGTVVQVLYAGDPTSARQELARSIYDALVTATTWDLELDSDEADDTIAPRTAAP